jgi:hypothetical protein
MLPKEGLTKLIKEDKHRQPQGASPGKSGPLWHLWRQYRRKGSYPLAQAQGRRTAIKQCIKGPNIATT